MLIRNLWKEKFPLIYLQLKLEKTAREREPISPIARANKLILNSSKRFKTLSCFFFTNKILKGEETFLKFMTSFLFC